MRPILCSVRESQSVCAYLGGTRGDSEHTLTEESFELWQRVLRSLWTKNNRIVAPESPGQILRIESRDEWDNLRIRLSTIQNITLKPPPFELHPLFEQPLRTAGHDDHVLCTVNRIVNDGTEIGSVD